MDFFPSHLELLVCQNMCLSHITDHFGQMQYLFWVAKPTISNFGRNETRESNLHCTTLFQHTVLYSPNIRLGAKNSKSIKHGVLEKSSKVTNPPNCL